MLLHEDLGGVGDRAVELGRGDLWDKQTFFEHFHHVRNYRDAEKDLLGLHLISVSL